MIKNLSSEEIISLTNEFVMPTYLQEITMVKGEGINLWDIKGNKYIDFTSGIAVTNIGHCHPNVLDAMHNQAKNLMHTSNLYYNELQPQLAKKLIECAGLDSGKCFFCNSGAEANEGMIKLARLWGSDKNKYEIITMNKSFHGRTLATLTATGQDKVKKGFGPLPKGFVHAEYNDINSVKNLINSNTVAVMVEAVQGEGGVIPANIDFMQELQIVCKENDILLLCDEVQAGIGRTGKWFGFQHYDIKPDVVSLAKGLGNGFPIGAIIASGDLSNTFKPGHHATTFGGSPLACSVALSVIQTIENGILEHTNYIGRYLKEELSPIISDHSEWVQDIRGIGLMIGVVLKVPAKKLQDRLLKKRLLTIATAGNILRMLPPLIVNKEEVDHSIKIIKEVCNELHADMLIDLKE